MTTTAAIAVAAVVPLRREKLWTVRHHLEDGLSDGDRREPTNTAPRSNVSSWRFQTAAMAANIATFEDMGKLNVSRPS